MSNINELTNNIASSVSSQDNNKSYEKSSKVFDSVFIQALQNCNGKRPDHVCCCDNSLNQKEVSNDQEVLAADNLNIDDKHDTSEISKASEEITAGTCFTMFIKISTRITREAGDVLCGKFKNTTIAFADALKADKSYNENLLTSYMQKVDEKLAAQTADIKSYLSEYIDNMFAAVKSSVNGLNTALLSSSNLLGDSLSCYSNYLGNSNLLSSSNLFGSSSNSLSQTLLSGLSSSLFGSSSSTGSTNLSGYSAVDVANAKITAAISGASNYTYGIGTSLNNKRYAGRNLELIRSSQLETSSSGSLKMVDSKGNKTTGVVPSNIEIGNPSASTVGKTQVKKVIENSDSTNTGSISISDADETINAMTKNDDKVLLVSSDKKSEEIYSAAFLRKNNIIDLFKDLILKNMNDSASDSVEKNTKSIEAKVKVTFA